MIRTMLNTLLDIIQTPVKSLAVSFTGALTGTLPLAVTEYTGAVLSPPVHFMQYAVWYLTALVAIASLVSWIQKQIDRYHKLHHQEPKKTDQNENEDNN